MLTTPKMRSMLFTDTSSVVNAFVKLRQVDGDVACLDFGRKNFGYRGILRVSAVNFPFLSEDEQEAVIESFKDLLNGLEFPLQILIRNRLHKLDNYLQMLDTIEGAQAPIARDHGKFVRMLASRRSLVRREFYVIVPADQPAARDKTEALFSAQTQLKLRLGEVQQKIENMGLTASRLTTAEIVQLYQSCYTPWEEPVTEGMPDGSQGGLTAPFVDSHLYEAHFSSSNLQTSVAQTPANEREGRQKAKQIKKLAEKKAKKNKLPNFVKIPGLIIPGNIQVFPSYMLIGEEEEQHEYLRTLSIASYPRIAYPGWFDSIIQVDEPNIDFTIYVNPVQPEKVDSHLSKKASEFRGAVMVSERQGRTADPATTIALRDVEKLRENIARGNERVFTISAFIQVRGRDRRELSVRSDRVARAVRSLDFRALPAHWQHHSGLISCLPDINNQMGRGRLFGTGAASTFYPFTSGDNSMEMGAMFGAQPNSGLVILDPFNHQVLENGNLMVFAKSGTGKSFFLKTVTSRLLSTCNVYVVDPEAEYKNMCETVRGQQVQLSSDALKINPFELYGGVSNLAHIHAESPVEENFFREKLLSLVSLLELMLSSEGMLPQKEKAFLYRCLLKIYEIRGINMDPSTYGHVPPNMQELYEIMSSSVSGHDRFGVGQDTYGLSQRLVHYLPLFPKRTQVVFDNRFIDFTLPNVNPTLKPIVLFSLIEFLWIKMRQVRQGNVLFPNTIILIDEAWLLMRFHAGAKFLEELARRIRRYGGALWCATQNTNEFLSLDEGQSILSMTAMKFLMKQDTSTIDSVARTFHLNAVQKSFLLGARRGEGLFATKSWFQMEVLASPLEVKMATTAPASTLSQNPSLTRELEQHYSHTQSYEKEYTQGANGVAVDERKYNGMR